MLCVHVISQLPFLIQAYLKTNLPPQRKILSFHVQVVVGCVTCQLRIRGPRLAGCISHRRLLDLCEPVCEWETMGLYGDWFSRNLDVVVPA